MIGWEVWGTAPVGVEVSADRPAARVIGVQRIMWRHRRCRVAVRGRGGARTRRRRVDRSSRRWVGLHSMWKRRGGPDQKQVEARVPTSEVARICGGESPCGPGEGKSREGAGRTVSGGGELRARAVGLVWPRRNVDDRYSKHPRQPHRRRVTKAMRATASRHSPGTRPRRGSVVLPGRAPSCRAGDTGPMSRPFRS